MVTGSKSDDNGEIGRNIVMTVSGKWDASLVTILIIIMDGLWDDYY